LVQKSPGYMMLRGYCGSCTIDTLVCQGLYNEIDAGLCV
jgi:hypothetical protein